MTALERAIREFLADGTARGLSQNTTGFYERELAQFTKYTLEKGESTVVEALGAGVLRLYMGDCMARLSPGGAHARMRAVRALCGFLVSEGLLEVNPFNRLKLPKVPDVDLDVIQERDFRVLLAAAAIGRNPLRDQAILSALLDTGLRASELCGVRLEDVIRSQGGIVVRRGKGGKQRFVPVSKLTMKRLARYEGQERPHSTLESLFLTDAHTPLGYTALRSMLERHCEEAGIKQMRPHAFRRGFAVAYLRNGGDVFTLKRILGHTTLTMSEKYARMNAQDVKEAHLRASPVGRVRAESH